MGYEPIDQLAQTIYDREGPSGPNRVRLHLRVHLSTFIRSELMSQDYVYKLAESVRKLYPDVKDDYLFELEVSHIISYPLGPPVGQ